MSSDDRWSVAAVVLTRNRADLLRTTLDQVSEQTRAPNHVIVVDNASEDATPAMLRQEFPQVRVLRCERNLGPAGGRSRGMQAAFDDLGVDAAWFIDDDDTPSRHTLATTIDIARRIPNLGALGQSGGTLRFGIFRHGRYGPTFDDAPEARAVDYVGTDGSLVTREAYDRVGPPDVRYFAMLEDVEHPLRVKRAGLAIARADLGFTFQRLGATNDGAGGPGPPWRLYYQTRNHLRMALDQRSAPLVVGWLYRQVGGLLFLVRQDRRLERFGYRVRGTVDALRNRMGEVVPPT